MIVVDTNIIAYMLMPGPQAEHAKKAYAADPAWVAPMLWRSEFRNILNTAVRQHGLPKSQAKELMEVATELMWRGEYEAPSDRILELAAESGCSTYDCEFVALAMELGVPLVTADKRIASVFDPPAIHLSVFL